MGGPIHVSFDPAYLWLKKHSTALLCTHPHRVTDYAVLQSGTVKDCRLCGCHLGASLHFSAGTKQSASTAKKNAVMKNLLGQNVLD